MLLKSRVPLLKSPLWVFIGEKEKIRFTKKCEEYGADGSEPTGNGCQCGSFVWLKEPELGVFAHEVHHFASAAVDFLGIQDKNREVEAYIIEWAMKVIWPKIALKSDGERQ